MIPAFDPALVKSVIDLLKDNLNPLDVLDKLSKDQITIIKATWAIGSGIRHVGEWDEAVKYHIPVKGDQTDKEYMVEHDLLKNLKVGLAKLYQN